MVEPTSELFAFPPEVAETLGHYVYAYVDPRNDAVFYIGKGCGDRAFHHLGDSAETAKIRRITAIRRAARSPRIEILVYGLSEAEALRVEAVCIDLIGLPNLTNLVTGHNTPWGGRRPVEELVGEIAARPVVVDQPALAFSINQTYRYPMTPADLYDATRGIWRLERLRASRARLALAVYRGVVKEVYEIARWDPAGTTPYLRRPFEPDDFRGKLEFVGAVASSELRDEYLGGRIQGLTFSQAGMRYLNCGPARRPPPDD